METTETDNGNDDELDESGILNALVYWSGLYNFYISGQDGENPIDEAMNDEPETNGATDYIEDQQEEEPQEEEPQEEYIQEGEEEEEPQDNNVQDDSKEEATAGEEKDHLTLDFEEALPDDVSYSMPTCLIRKFVDQQKLLMPYMHTCPPSCNNFHFLTTWQKISLRLDFFVICKYFYLFENRCFQSKLNFHHWKSK